jgi:hypothetical protein
MGNAFELLIQREIITEQWGPEVGKLHYGMFHLGASVTRY